MKVKWNLVGNNFTHTSNGHTGLSGTHGKVPKLIEWNTRNQSDISFYIDGEMRKGFDDHPEHRKFGWLLESQSIRQHIVDDLRENFETFFEHYEAIFTHNQSLIALDDRFKFTFTSGSWIQDFGLHPKTKLISAINSGKAMNKGHQWRNDFISIHAEHFDLFGNSTKHLPRKEIGLNDYMFSVAIENCQYDSYFTEKILDCFATGTIPIYAGAPDIGNFFNSEGILFIHEDFDFRSISEELYYSKIDAVKDNLERVRQCHCAEDWIYQHYQHLF